MNQKRPAGQAGEAVIDRPTVELESFVSEHYGRLLRLAGLICHSVTDAEDAVQAGLERAWRKRGSLNDESRLRPWLDRIVVREAIRTGSRRPDHGELPADAVGPNRADEWAGLRIAFAELSPHNARRSSSISTRAIQSRRLRKSLAPRSRRSAPDFGLVGNACVSSWPQELTDEPHE